MPPAVTPSRAWPDSGQSGNIEELSCFDASKPFYTQEQYYVPEGYSIYYVYEVTDKQCAYMYARSSRSKCKGTGIKVNSAPSPPLLGESRLLQTALLTTV